MIHSQQGDRLGYILSPVLFNMYSKNIFKKAIDRQNVELILIGERISTVCYPDDIVFVAQS